MELEKEVKLCDYGCGKEGKFKIGNRWCCEDTYQKCPESRRKASIKNKNRSEIHILNLKISLKNKKKHNIKIENSSELCSYGCGKQANFYFPKVKKYCCSDFYMKCSSMHQKTMDSWRDIKEIETTEICSYGCKEQAHYKFKNGKFCCSSNHSSCKNVRKNNSIMNRIKQAGENNARFGAKLTTETISKISKKIIDLWKTDEYRIKTAESLRNLWFDPKFLENWKRGKNQKPNNPEKFLIGILEKYYFKYVGDYSFWIGGKNPDFINFEKRKIIELFGDYWHSEEFRQDGKTNIEHELDRINIFKKYDYDCLVLWEKDIKNIEELENKIKIFIQ